MAGDPNYSNAWLAPSGSSGGSNQYMSYPNINPLQASHGQTNYTPNVGSTSLGHGLLTNPTYSPAFTEQFYNMLQGLTPQALTAQNPLMSILQQFFSGGPGNLPGAGTLSEMSQTGDPISALPAWQSMIDAQQQNIGRNQADLKEQFAFAGDLQSSPFGDAMQNFQSQTTKDQNATLAQMMQQAMEAAMGRKLSAASTLDQNTLDFTSQAGQVGSFEQSQSQNAINMLLQMIQQAAYAQPGTTQTQTASQTFSNIMGGLGDIFKGSVSKSV